ncbi:MAG: hypothetical protein ABIK89_25445 [Planctomycetota bacterium]
MSHKRTHASVTDEPCDCGYLQQAADDPDNPIVFDEETSEYQFTYHEPGHEGLSMLVIYHCPFCGGAAPESKRSLLFAVISRSEQARLSEQLSRIGSIEDALDIFGEPQLDDFSVASTPSREDDPPAIHHLRALLYDHLSDVANVRITERPDGRIHWSLEGKYVGGQPNRT